VYVTGVTWPIVEICSKVCNTLQRKHFQACNMSKGHTAVVSPGGCECILSRVWKAHLSTATEEHVQCRYSGWSHVSLSSQKCPFRPIPWRAGIPSYTWFLGHMSLTPNNISVSHFFTGQPCQHRQTDIQTTLRTTSVAIAASIHCVQAMWPKNEQYKIARRGCTDYQRCVEPFSGWNTQQYPAGELVGMVCCLSWMT